MTGTPHTRLRTLSEPAHLPALRPAYVHQRPALGLGACDPPPRILLLYGSLRERSFSRHAAEEAARLLDEALAEDNGSHLSEEVVSEIEKLLLTSSAASDSLRDQGEGVEFELSDEEEGESSDETDDLLATAITRLSGAEEW